MADRRGIIVPLVILAFIFLTPDPQRGPASRLHQGPTLDDVIAEEQRSLSELQNSTFPQLGFGAKYAPVLNLTGLEPERGYAWDAFPVVQVRAWKLLRYALGQREGEMLEQDGAEEMMLPPLYTNVTGFVHGKWVRSKLEKSVPHPQVNLSDYAPQTPFGPIQPRPFERNITGDGGDVRVRFHERKFQNQPELDEDEIGIVTSMEVEVSLADPSTSSEHDMRMLGVYFPRSGQAVVTTTSDKYAGIFILPQFIRSKLMFEAAKTQLNGSISRAIQRQINRETEKFNPWSSTLNGEVETAFSTPECELIMFMQQLPPLATTNRPGPSILHDQETELRYPTGAFLPPSPELRFSMIAFSPDCGYVLESKGEPDFAVSDGTHLTGPKSEVLQNNSRHHLIFFTFALVGQMVLLMRQMREASTPSTRSRISLYTIALLALGDGFTFMAFLLISFFIGGLWVTLVGTAFMAFMSVSFFGMRFLMDIWTVQAPERERRARAEVEEMQRREARLQEALQRIRERQAAERAAAGGETTDTENVSAAEPDNAINTQQSATEQPPIADNTQQAPTAPAPTTNNGPPSTAGAPIPVPPPRVPFQPAPGFLPLPVTAQRPADTGAAPVFMPSDQEGLEPVAQPTGAAPQTITIPTQSFGSLYTKFYLLLLGTIFLSLNAASWPAPIRGVYFTTLGLFYLSFWVPQIIRNVQRNCRHALNWEYVAGQSVLRLLPFAYFFGFSGNVLFADVDYTSLALLVIWVWIQVVVLVSQELVGPRWFIRKDWAPPAYDYHPILREDEEGNTLPIGFSEATAASSDSAPSSPISTRDRSDSIPLLKRRDSTAAATTKGKRLYDCAICMQDLEVSIIGAGESSSESVTGPAGLLARRMYMVTPCRHIFHSACLEGWMKYRLQCPICRETLPPL